MENLTRQKNTAPQEQEAVSNSRSYKQAQHEKALNFNFVSKQITTMNFRKSQPVSQNRGKKELLR